MIPADTEDLRKEYEVLNRELEQYNPDLAEKSRVIAITKSDLTDHASKETLAANLPEQIPHVFISSVAHQGLDELKDLLWHELNRETFQDMEKIVRKNMDISRIPLDPEERENTEESLSEDDAEVE
jgi:GTP-binding protein